MTLWSRRELVTKLPTLPIHAPHVERRIHKALLEDQAAHASDRKGVLGLSQIGKCERNLWAELNGIPSEREFEPQILTVFKLGHAIESHVIGLLRMAGFIVQKSDPETGRQFSYSAFNGKARGHIDGKIGLGPLFCATRTALLEVKSSKASKFDALIEAQSYAKWNPDYGAQVQAYMGFSGLEECLVVVYCKDDSQIYSEVIRFNSKEWPALYAKAERIVTSEEILDRPEAATSRYCEFCKWCDRGEWCWGSTAGVQFDE